MRQNFSARMTGTLLATVAITSAHAATYRCESVSHEVRYQAQPCDGGKVLNHQDLRTDAQRADTHQATQASVKLGKQLERDRRRLDQQGEKRRAVSMDEQGQAASKPSASSTQGQTLKREHPFTARVPKSKKSD